MLDQHADRLEVGPVASATLTPPAPLLRVVETPGALGSPPRLPLPDLTVVAPRPRRRFAPPSLRGRRHGDPRHWVIRTSATPGTPGDLWGDTHFADSLAGAVRRAGGVARVARRGESISPDAEPVDVNLVLRGLNRVAPVAGAVNVLWVISHPEDVTREEAEEFDVVFAASTSWARRRDRRWNVPVLPLLQCTDATRFGTLATPPARSSTAALFVGNSRNVLRPSVRVPIEHGIPVEVHGYGWETLIGSDRVSGTFVANTALSGMYRAARVVLNDHWDDMLREGFVSNRLFDVVASGGRVISDRVDGIAEIFRGAVTTYADETELAHLLRTCPTSIFPRQSVLDRHARHVRRHHSFDARALVLGRAVDDVVGTRATSYRGAARMFSRRSAPVPETSTASCTA